MKRISKLIVTATAAMFIAVPFSACNRAVALESPTGFNLDDRYILTWSPVSNARSYMLEITNTQTGHSTEATARRENYLLSTLEVGDYDIRVRAVGDGVRYDNSAWSAVLSFNRAFDSGCTYTAINNGMEYELTSAVSTMTELDMQDTYREKPVTSIGDYAFSRTNGLESITIGKNVKRIGKSAFYNCSVLKDITIPETVTEIGAAAFQSCRSLVSFKLPDAVTVISDNAFSYCRGLKEFDFNNATVIGTGSFAGCTGLTKLVIPDTITEIGVSAFDGSFFDGEGIEEVTIGKNVTTIGSKAFNNCKALKKVNFSDSGNLKEINAQVFFNNVALTSIELPDGLEIIGNRAFVGATALESVNIPDSVSVVGRQCFHNTKMYYDAAEAGEHLLYVDNWLVARLFYPEPYEIKQLYASNPEGLENTEIFPEDTVGIADYVFYGDSDIEEVVLSRNIKYLGASAFSWCENIYRFDASDSSLEIVDLGAFYHCPELVQVFFNHDNPRLKEISNMAFFECEKLSYNSDLGGKLIPRTVERIGSLAFEGTEIADSADDFGVIYADDWVIGCGGTYAWKGNEFKPKGKAVANIELKDGTKGIADYAFTDCRKLETISNTSGVEIIGRGAFYRSNKLMGYNFNTNITTIDDYTFYLCANLDILRFPSALRTIGRSAFYGCSSLSSIDLATPTRLESVGEFAFYGCTGATELELGSRLSEISPYAFYRCYRLTSVTIPSNIKKIGQSAFSGCLDLREVIFEEGVEEIGAYAFYHNQFLSEIKLSDSVKTIGKAAFLNCSLMRSIDLNQVETIGDYAFAGNINLINIVIPESVKSVGVGAFYRLGAIVSDDRESLNGSRSVIVREGVGRMDAHVFAGCRATLYIEGANKSGQWGSSWNSSRCPVVWGVTLSDDGTYVVSLKVQKNTFEYYDKLNAPAAPYRAGYTFAGWSLSATGDEIAYTVKDVMNAPVGTTLYAVYMQV